jgi:demethylmenaquinone methyltransferase/2-methoxy-6-polyprenyl-1,4-benzoquinol methylase
MSAFDPAPVRPDLAVLLDEAASESPMTVLAPGEVRSLYDRLAPFYDVASKPYGWFGTRRLAERAIDELRLEPGDTVVDLGTGTGRNLEALSAAVGRDGKVIGVDLSPGMLEVAQGKVDAAGLVNVELVEADMTTYDPPTGTAAALSTYAMEMLPNYQEVIDSLAGHVRPGGRVVLNGLRHPDRWPEWVTSLGSALSRPFGVSDAYQQHRPWEAIERSMIDIVYDDAMAGAAYLSAGTVPNRGENV